MVDLFANFQSKLWNMSNYFGLYISSYVLQECFRVYCDFDIDYVFCYYVLCECALFCFVFFSFWERGDSEAVYCILLFTMRRNCKLCNRVLKLWATTAATTANWRFRWEKTKCSFVIIYWSLRGSFVCYFLLHSFALHAHTLTIFDTHLDVRALSLSLSSSSILRYLELFFSFSLSFALCLSVCCPFFLAQYCFVLVFVKRHCMYSVACFSLSFLYTLALSLYLVPFIHNTSSMAIIPVRFCYEIGISMLMNRIRNGWISAKHSKTKRTNKQTNRQAASTKIN